MKIRAYMGVLIKALTNDYEVKDVEIGETEDGYIISFKEDVDESDDEKHKDIKHANFFRKITIDVKFDKKIEAELYEMSNWSPGYCSCPNCEKPEV